ncbi:hypothetical protein GZH49_12195 [Nocardia terpenica]|uniref:hypothetical protein n=1 Tax=Nocardia terpenica TaxID=455432 RepID=UPI002FE0E7EB
MTAEITVSALVDCAHKPARRKEVVHRIEQVEIPVADPRRCEHADTVCAECAWIWQLEYLFTETLPWEHTTE